MATADHHEAYGDGAPLTVLFKTPARAKLLSVFVAEPGRDLSASEVARHAGVVRSTVYVHLEDFEELVVIEHTRDAQAGHSLLYQLNDDIEIATLHYQLEGVTLKRLQELEGEE